MKKKSSFIKLDFFFLIAMLTKVSIGFLMTVILNSFQGQLSFWKFFFLQVVRCLSLGRIR